MRILVVEDEPTLAAQLAATLQAAGYAVDTAANGRDAGYMGEVETFDTCGMLPADDGLVFYLSVAHVLGDYYPVTVSWDTIAGVLAPGVQEKLTK